jgi:iron complex outermembrane receptor protein
MKRDIPGHTLSYLALTGALYLASAPAFTQSAPAVSAATDSATSKGGLEEIVVTATRRETSLQETPISISALSSADIEKNRVVDFSDVTRLTPSLVYVPRGGTEGYISLRGAIILDDSPGTDPAVSMFVDDVVRVSVADAQPDLFDIDRVEVLKGPQGTLFGRNSIGGVVSLYTKQPTFKTEGHAEVTYGDHNLVEVKGVYNTPLVEDHLAARIVLTESSVSGNVRDITTGGELNGQHLWTARGKLLFTPTDDFKFITTLDYLHKKGSESTWVLGNFQPALDPGLTFNPEQTAQRTPGGDWQQNWGVTGRADWATQIGTLTSITGYRRLGATDLKSNAADPLDSLLLSSIEHDNQITEELRLASPVGHRLSWIVGAYYLHNSKVRTVDSVLSYQPGMIFQAIAAGIPSPLLYDSLQAAHTTSAAPFADITYAITDELKLDLGGRYTWQRKSGNGFVNSTGGVLGGPIAAVYAASWTAFTPKATVIYQPTSALMTYATASRGFLSGGFNAQGSTSLALGTPFDSEYVWNYEVGEKFNALENRLQVNIAGFLDRYTNLQVIQLDTRTSSIDTTNAGAANVDGIETDIAVAPVRWLTADVKYDYLHSKFTKYLINNGDGTFTDYTGKKVPFTPTHRVTASAEVHTDLSNGAGIVAVGGDYTYRSSQEFTVGNDIPQDIRDVTAWRGIVNLHASWSTEDDRWRVLFWGKNVTNQHYAVFAQDATIYVASINEFANSPPNHIFEIQAGPYRSFGVTLETNF